MKKLHEETIFKSGRNFYREMPNGSFNSNDGRSLKYLPTSARAWSMLWAKDITSAHLQLNTEQEWFMVTKVHMGLD